MRDSCFICSRDSYDFEQTGQVSDKLRYILGFGSVEMAISTNPKPTIYRKLYENTGPGVQGSTSHVYWVVKGMVVM